MMLTLSKMFQLLVILLSIYLMVRSLTSRAFSKSHYFQLLALAVLFYTIGLYFELDATNLSSAYMALRVQYLGIPFLAVCLYMFVRDWDNRTPKGSLKHFGLFAFSYLCLFLANAYPDITLFFRQLSYNADATPQLTITRGPFFYLLIGYSLLFTALTAYEVLRYFPNVTPGEKRQRLMFILAAILPNMSVAVLALDHTLVPAQLGPASLVLALCILSYYILNYRARDWMPYAMEGVVDRMNDGFVLIDYRDRFVTANHIAERYFPALSGIASGTPVRHVPDFPPLLLGEGDESAPEFTLPNGITLRASISQIEHGNEPICKCIMLYDITETKALMNELEELATHDNLTGILNRATFFKMANRDFDLHMRTQTNAALLMIDIDYFKEVNDNHGHLFGDMVIAELGRLLQSRMRRTDIGGRYGGEEFAIFLPTTDERGAMIIAEDIRIAVEDTLFVAGGVSHTVTVSIGVAPLEHFRHKEFTDLIADADVALYRAKNTGRNRVLSYEDSAPVPII